MNERLKEEENELIHTYHVKQFLRPRTSAWQLLLKGSNRTSFSAVSVLSHV